MKAPAATPAAGQLRLALLLLVALLPVALPIAVITPPAGGVQRAAAQPLALSSSPPRRARAAPPRSRAVVAMAGAVTVQAPRAPKNPLRRSWWVVKRSVYIWTSCIGHALKVARLRGRGLEGDALVNARASLAAELRDTLIKLGPTFIKIGQLLSTRVDVFTPEVIAELAKLQNEVPPFPTKRALKIIRDELGAGVEDIYASFDPTPLAAASLAQVHRAVLKTGEEVIVKVQRENLLELFKIDLWNINLVARLADRFDPQTEAVGANWKAIAKTSGEVLFREVDFDVEREAAVTFAKNFEKSKSVKIPKMYEELCTKKVVTMEYCPGVKISDTQALKEKGYDPVHLATRLTTSYLEQVCRHGFFHCDPHPGNLAVDDGYPGGRLIYYDFGMMEVMETDIKKGFVDLVFSIYENLPREACDALEAMGVLRPGVDRYSIERIARNYLNTFQSTLSNADNKWENEMSEKEKRETRRARRAKARRPLAQFSARNSTSLTRRPPLPSQIGQDLFATQADKPFVFPPKWTFVFRAFSTIDGISKGLTKTYDLSRISQPFLKELANLRDGSTTTTALRTAGKRLGLRPKDLGQVVTQPRRVAEIVERVRRIEDGDVKLRVRTIEVERMLDRLEERQTMIGAALGAALLYQLALRAAGALNRYVMGAGAVKLLWESWRARERMRKMVEQQLRFANQGSQKYDDDDVYTGKQTVDDDLDGSGEACVAGDEPMDIACADDD